MAKKGSTSSRTTKRDSATGKVVNHSKAPNKEKASAAKNYTSGFVPPEHPKPPRGPKK